MVRSTLPLYESEVRGTTSLPLYYHLRLLPYVVPLINNWKRRMLKERNLMDSIF